MDRSSNDLSLAVLLLLLVGVIMTAVAVHAAGYTTGDAFKTARAHHPHCGVPISHPTWTGTNQAHQVFSRCIITGRWTVQHTDRTPTVAPVTPTPRPTPTAVPTIPAPKPTATADCTADYDSCLVLALVNADRRAYGSPPLTLISDATTQRHADDMMADETIWHQSAAHPSESFPYDGFMGENVGAAPSLQQIDQLMIGEGTSGCAAGVLSHACNIVSPRFRYLAVGIAQGPPYGYFLCEDFR